MSNKKVQSIDRAIDVAAEVFARSRLEDVSIGHISELSHCSTATIYGVFGSKEALYRAAAERLLARCTFPRLRAFPDENPMWPLLDLLKQRLEFLSHPDRNPTNRVFTAHIEHAGAYIRAKVEQEYIYFVRCIGGEVEKCVAAELLRPLENSSLIYTLMACTAYEPMTIGLFFEHELRIDIGDILQKSFSSLVTDRGRAEVERFLRLTVEKRRPAAEDELPARNFNPSQQGFLGRSFKKPV